MCQDRQSIDIWCPDFLILEAKLIILIPSAKSRTNRFNCILCENKQGSPGWLCANVLSIWRQNVCNKKFPRNFEGERKFSHLGASRSSSRNVIQMCLMIFWESMCWMNFLQNSHQKKITIIYDFCEHTQKLEIAKRQNFMLCASLWDFPTEEKSVLNCQDFRQTFIAFDRL